MSGPMQGTRVVELGIWVAAPSGGAILADWGADVIKLEPPTGDPLRQIRHVLGPDIVDCPFFDADNRSKRSVALDLRSSEELASALELIDSADVFLTNIRPAALERLGLDSRTLLERKPDLVYAIVTGYGLEGPDAAAGAYDMGAYWARGGVADSLTQPGGETPIQRSGMGDHVTGITVAGMISAALLHRERTGEGQLVSTSLLRVAAWQISSDINMRLMLDREPTRNQRTTEANPVWNNYSAGDGKKFWLMGVEADRHWPKLLRLVDRPEWATEPRYATPALRGENAVEIIALLDEIFVTRTRAEWGALFDTERDFFWSPVNTVDEVISDPQTHASGSIIDVPKGDTTVAMVASPADFHGTPAAPSRFAPLLGEHTDELLTELASRRATTR
ncbi:CoA transferase (plasmid) [Rhodococcus erythropolis]|uniref:CaiB/BaiF CoA transferase family protein n=1 Tax=Rhodococcus TaxID=1827 RepID=UPI00124908AB|nr:MULTISPECIES: CoA transferase [Rhodococcus]MCJ0949888.1 CoA transferase [Rhodococcus sp. ARC_M8]MCQ4152116.1 CoA transferase [Rhodococcus qingshengii]MDJ0441242.1 CoA transferase [Rhodococcus qingshengii]QEX08450.1 CoA transferase [Rhodococcus erythropolis]